MKPKDALTIGEVAANFGWSTRFVEGLVRSEQIPGLQINGQYLFRREDIIDWLDQKIQTLDASRLKELEAKIEDDWSEDARNVSRHLDVHKILSPLSISLRQPISSKRMVLEKLVESAVKSKQVTNPEHLLASLIERERLHSTALPGGLAICHPRRPLPLAVTHTTLAFLRTREPVAFGADCGEPTQLFFLIVAADEQSHLHALSRIARLGSRTNLLDQLRSSDVIDPHQVITIIRELELAAAR